MMMLKKIWYKIKFFFISFLTCNKNNVNVDETYEIVEMQVEDGGYRQGVQIKGHEKFDGIIFSFFPKVKFKELEDGRLLCLFDYVVHKNPKKLELKDSDLRPIIGDIAMKIIIKDNNAD